MVMVSSASSRSSLGESPRTNYAGETPGDHEVTLELPLHWSVAPNPVAAEVEARAEGWLRKIGVIHDASGLEKFRKLAVAEYANWPFPSASRARAEVITKFLSLWIFYDDVIEEQDDQLSEAIRDAVAGRPERRPDGHPHLVGWWELGSEYRRSMSPAWTERHAMRFMDWVTSVGVEREAAQAFRETGRYPSCLAHLLRRRVNIGMVPNLDFVEYQMEWELPEELLDDPLMLRAVDAAADAVAIINDVFGFTKDRKLRWSNLVSCCMHERSLSARDAFRWACSLVEERAMEIDRLAHQLVTTHPETPRLGEWFTGLRHVVYGFAMWHSRAPRYAATHEVDGGRIRIVCSATG